MTMTQKDIRVVLRDKPEKVKTVIFAFPDVGLVGPIAVKHIVDELGMREIGYVDSDKLPPVTSVHESRPTFPIRIFKKDELVSVTSEVPISPNLINSLSSSLLDWLMDLEVEKSIILGGLTHQGRMEIDDPEVHGVPSNDDMEELLENYDIHILQEGFIAGINGVLLREHVVKELSGIYLMAEAYQQYPDPGAAASLLESLNDLEGLDISVEKLREKEEEIKLAARDLMRKTQRIMQKSAKDQEEEMPMMYG